MSSDGTPLLLTSTLVRGSGTRAEQVASESVDRIRLSRAPYMKYKYLLSNRVRRMGLALQYFRRVAKETYSSAAQAVSR